MRAFPLALTDTNSPLPTLSCNSPGSRFSQVSSNCSEEHTWLVDPESTIQVDLSFSKTHDSKTKALPSFELFRSLGHRSS